MESQFHFVAPPSVCGYLPEQLWQLEYEYVGQASAAEYMERMAQGWRRFGGTFFRPRCAACQACQSLRVLVERFRPNRSQRRTIKANQGEVTLRIGRPSVTRAKLQLYDRYHGYQADAKGWPRHPARSASSYADSFVDNPFPTQEWCYYLGPRLVGVGYVDDLPGGLSAIYFFYDPDERDRGLGTWNILSLIAHAAERRLPHVYLGYYVTGCPSMEYKARFTPNQILDSSGVWRDFRTGHSPSA
jgi:arginine-tRNA-protein transferase